MKVFDQTNFLINYLSCICQNHLEKKMNIIYWLEWIYTRIKLILLCKCVSVLFFVWVWMCVSERIGRLERRFPSSACVQSISNWELCNYGISFRRITLSSKDTVRLILFLSPLDLIQWSISQTITVSIVWVCRYYLRWYDSVWIRSHWIDQSTNIRKWIILSVLVLVVRLFGDSLTKPVQNNSTEFFT